MKAVTEAKMKQELTEKKEVQETTAIEHQDRQSHFRITQTLCTSHYNKRKALAKFQNLENTLKIDLSSHKAS